MLEELAEQRIAVRFKTVEAMMTMVNAWPLGQHVVCILTYLSQDWGTWKAVLTLRDDALAYLRAHPERKAPIIAGVRELTAAHHPCALLLTDGAELSILPLAPPVRVTLPPAPGYLLDGASLAAE